MRTQTTPAVSSTLETARFPAAGRPIPAAARPPGWHGVAAVLGIPGGAFVLEGRARAVEAARAAKENEPSLVMS